ncbi:hypothetical protein [Streptosporangium vulgare]
MRGPLGRLRAKMSAAYGGEKIPLDDGHGHGHGEDHDAIGAGHGEHDEHAAAGKAGDDKSLTR